MSKQFDPTNSGTLSINNDREKDTHPHRKGKLNVDGKWFWISGWNKTGPHGEFISLAINEMTEEQVEKYINKKPEPEEQAPVAEPAPTTGNVASAGFDDDDIPF